MMNRRDFAKIGLAAPMFPLAIGANDAAAQDNEAGSSPATQQDKAAEIIAGPYLQSPAQDSMTIMWITAQPCVSWVEWGDGKSLGQKTYPIDKGQVEAGKTIHRVCLDALKPARQYFYRVHSMPIILFEAYDVRFGPAASSGIYCFTTFDDNAEKTDVVFLNDVHQNSGMLKTLIGIADKQPFDLAVYGGDMISDINSCDEIVKLVKESGELFAAQKPFVYARGNHETRGKCSRMLSDYVSLPGGEYYCAFTCGCVRFIVLDSGEDKPDDDREYFSLARFSDYRKIQGQWLNNELNSGPSRQAAFRVVVSHIPFWGIDKHDPRSTFGADDCRSKWAPIVNDRIDMLISGHTHSCAVVESGRGHNYPVAIGGNPSEGGGTLIRLTANTMQLKMTMTRDDGQQVGSFVCERPEYR